MTDSMKFGPEWLRNLSADSCNNGGGGGGTTSLTTPRYQLAEHRYGREEMLILFDRNCKPPESLTNFSTLYIEKTQLPLALIQMTEDETRMWNGGITNVGGQGRGGSVDRGGRGKSGRGSLYSSHYSRGVGFDDSGDGRRIDSMPFPGRNRPFDRSQSERGWSERNGASDPGEWNGSSTSPRKELSRGPGGSSVVEGNWRRHRGAGTEDDDGWRKWGRSSWREGGSMDRDRLDRNEGDGGEEGVTKGGRFEHRGNHRTSHDLSHHPPARTARTWESNHHDINHDNLPEWATENPSESGGSFDASGAFHGGIYSDDDEDGVISAGGTQESRTRRVSEGSAGSTTKPSGKHLSYSSSQGQPLNRGPPSSSGGGGSGSGSGSSTISTVNKDRQKSLHPVDCTKEKLVEKERRSNSPSSTKSAITSITPITPTDSSVTTKTLTSTSLSSSISASASTSALASVSASASASSSTSVSTATSVPALVSALVSASASSPPETVQKRSNATAATVKAKAKTAVTNEAEIGKPMSVDCSGNNKNKSPSKTQTTEEVKVQTEIKLDQSISVAKRQQQIPLQTEPPQKGIVVVHGTGTEETRQKGDDDLDRMKEVADALVAKLMADEESHREKTTASVPPSIGNQPSTVPSTNGQEKWFYRDPQGEVQGPFLASEMAEWCKAGYFNAGLMVRRTCDERYTTLGELMKICGRIPFAPGPPIPPLKLTDQGLPTVSNTVPAALPTLPKTGMEDPILLLQYQHMRLLQNQQLLLMRTSAIAKLSQSEHWATLSPVEQNQLIYQYVIQDSEIPEVPTISTPPFVPHLPSQTSNPVMQLFSQMQQAKLQPDTAHLTSNPHSTTTAHPPTVDPIQQLIQQMGGMQNIPGMQQTNISSTTTPPTQQDNPIKSLLRQLNVNANGHPQTTHMDTVWPQPPPQITPQFNAQNWLAQVGPIPAVPPGQMPTSLWDLHTKEIKTEQQILEEQNLRLQEDRKKEELRKQEELQRQAEEEVEKKKKEEQVRQAEEAKRKDEERKRKEEEKKRKEEEKRKLEEERKKKEEKKRKEEEKKREEKKRKEEEKKREEKRKQEEQNLKKKQEEEKKKKEEMKKQEEKQKKEDEKRKKLEEEQRKQEEDRMRKEANARKQAEAEEQARRAEQRRREAEALRKLQERSKAPWAQAPRAPPPPTPINSFAEIQRLEREKKVEEQRVQQMMQQQLAQQKAIEAAQEASAADSSKRLQFKWAEKATASTKPLQVKSLAQIQQEEQERIAKQQERERQEKAGQKESTNVLQTAGIWGTASQCLNWANSSASSGSQAWSNNTGGGTSGFWDDPAPTKATAIAKQPAKQSATVKSPSSNQTLQINKPNKNKNKREEELVKKLFEQNTAKVDDFTQWCNKALSGLQVSVDIPTFVGFLRDIESAYEVKEYVRDYLGDNKQSSEFAKQFLDKRSKWRSAQRPQAQADDLCKPAPAINPNAPTEFQEVKGKSKKPKKGKMYRVDNKILGFSVTAAPDRINVGARDYGEGV